jgi:hypothetical protein
LDAVAASAVTVKLQEQLLAQEREMESRESTIIMWEDGLVAFRCALGEACIEHDVERAQAESVLWDFLAWEHTSSSQSKQLHHLSRTSKERWILLCLQEMDLEVQEVILAEEQAHGLHPFNG